MNSKCCGAFRKSWIREQGWLLDSLFDLWCCSNDTAAATRPIYVFEERLSLIVLAGDPIQVFIGT